ncbi:hypothetical protein pf16_193 [Pseudomonas phage pf16]|uniref:DNA topoisomerase 2 n=1 Tax=Pseudomonas phage pf16 TaxID=1815630 RepID=A0A1S5R451_9CAUD|nr:DNA topoisomerase II [Pseudomonas phage pf16]AND75116.1 hypothetical protein pf16_193 [Pseudomonas phage pf16]
MTDFDLSQYKRLSEVEHVLARPGMWVGSTAPTTQTSWAVSNGKMVEREVTYTPALLKLFDEIISNSVDEHIRSGSVKNIWVDIHPMAGEIIIEDDGGIPVKLHPEYGIYIPEMIFSEFRTGSNFGDEERTTAGLNGLGSKLTSVFSSEFRVETCDGTNQFIQVFKDNLSKRGEPVIRPYDRKGTKISFIPDYSRLNCEMDEGTIAKIERRVYDIAGCNPKIKVHFNGTTLKLNKFDDYVAMFSDSFVVDTQDKFEVALAACPESEFRQVSFVNGVDTFNGGTHITYVADQVAAKVREFIKKKHKVDVKPNIIKQQMFLFIKCTINAPMFTSQTKEFLSTEVRNYGASYSPSDKFIKKVLESDVVQKVLDWVEGEKRRAELAELRNLNKTTQTTNFLKRITKFDDATSKDRKLCSVFFTEGDSAKNTIMSARNAVLHGAFPMRGKLLNVRDIDVKKLASSEEFQNIMAIIGLKIGVKVESLDDLRFGKIVQLTDADADGSHIAGLFFNMIHQFWPELFALGAIYRMNTPLIIATAGNKTFEFFNFKDYTAWAEANPKHKHKFYKGLGGYDTKDFKRFLADEDKYLVQITIEDADDVAALDVAFDKKMADQRKLWLQEA